jgi:hypothetical protein
MAEQAWLSVRHNMALGGSVRNKPCPCGSGKKFKKCCLNRPEQHRIICDGKDAVAYSGDGTGTYSDFLLKYMEMKFNDRWMARNPDHPVAQWRFDIDKLVANDRMENNCIVFNNTGSVKSF